MKVGLALYHSHTPIVKNSSLLRSLLEEAINGILPQSEESGLISRELTQTILNQ